MPAPSVGLGEGGPPVSHYVVVHVVERHEVVSKPYGTFAEAADEARLWRAANPGKSYYVEPETEEAAEHEAPWRHPLAFVFLGVGGAPYLVAPWGGQEAWLFCWHKGKQWVSVQKINDPVELATYKKESLPPELADKYHDMHERSEVN